MLTANFWLCSAVFASFVFIGYRVWRGYKQRRDFYESLVRFCDHLITEINFSKNTVEQVIRRYIDSYSVPFAEVLLKYTHLVAWNADITRERLRGFIDKEDVVDFFFELGKHNAIQECEKIRSARSRFDGHFQTARSRLTREASIYFRICIIVGVGAVILLI